MTTETAARLRVGDHVRWNMAPTPTDRPTWEWVTVTWVQRANERPDCPIIIHATSARGDILRATVTHDCRVRVSRDA